MPCPEDCKDISKLDPYIKIDLRAPDHKFKRETKKRKNTGPNVIWNETIQFPKIKDNLAFIRCPPPPNSSLNPTYAFAHPPPRLHLLATLFYAWDVIYVQAQVIS